jgi:hypothetical protein
MEMATLSERVVTLRGENDEIKKKYTERVSAF